MIHWTAAGRTSLPMLLVCVHCAGESPKRALQVWRWLYADGCWVHALRETVGQQNGINAKFVEAAE